MDDMRIIAIATNCSISVNLKIGARLPDSSTLSFELGCRHEHSGLCGKIVSNKCCIDVL